MTVCHTPKIFQVLCAPLPLLTRFPSLAGARHSWCCCCRRCRCRFCRPFLGSHFERLVGFQQVAPFGAQLGVELFDPLSPLLGFLKCPKVEAHLVEAPPLQLLIESCFLAIVSESNVNSDALLGVTVRSLIQAMMYYFKAFRWMGLEVQLQLAAM